MDYVSPGNLSETQLKTSKLYPKYLSVAQPMGLSMMEPVTQLLLLISDLPYDFKF